MRLIEQYDKLIECKHSEVSIGWKCALIISYSVVSISSYSCALLFYTFWHDICGGHCLFWAEIKWDPDYSKNITRSSEANYDWTNDVIFDHHLNIYCDYFQFVLLFSCIFGITAVIMYSICGKGGYDETNLFRAPWRIVIPSLAFSIFMTATTFYAADQFSSGFKYFSERLQEISKEINRSLNSQVLYHWPCEAFQKFISIYNINNHDSCTIYKMIEVTAFLMTWSWAACILILFARVITAVDFVLLKVKIYEIPKDNRQRRSLFKRIGVKEVEKEKFIKSVTMNEDDTKKIS